VLAVRQILIENGCGFVYFLNMLKRVCRTIMMMGLLCGWASAQFDPDWVDQEIQARRQAYAHREVLAKSAFPGNSNAYDVTYYGLDLRLDIPQATIAGTTVIKGRAKVSGLATLDLNFTDNMAVTGAGGDGKNFTHANQLLQIGLRKALAVGDTFSVAVQYSGKPQTGGFQAFAFSYHDSAPIVSSLSEPYYAHSWFPCKDYPDDKADSADIKITVPSNLNAVSNGKLVSVTDNENGTHTFYWQERYPIAVYLISIAVSDYTHWTDVYTARDSTTMPVDYWIYPEIAATAQHNLSKTPAMLSFFSSIWGEYPFIREKYGQAQFSWYGGMEHQTCTSLGTLTNTFNEMLICHELAHSWWGNMITCANWKNIWLNEGFARYAEALWSENYYGFSGLRDYMNYLNRPDRWISSGLYIYDTTSVDIIFNRLVYDKGAWVLHMLRGLVGDTQFFNILHAYRARYAMQSVITEDFQGICEQVSGQDLSWFFQQWIYGRGQPHYKLYWSVSRNDLTSWTLKVTINQIQTTTTYFKMPLQLLIRTAGGDTNVVILDSLKTQTFNIFCTHQPESVVLDPNSWVLKNVTYSSIEPEFEDIPTRFRLAEPYPNPFNATVRFSIACPNDVTGRLTVLDLTGREVAVLASGRFRRGTHQQVWNPTTQSAGLYFISFKTEQLSLQRKILYLK